MSNNVRLRPAYGVDRYIRDWVERPTASAFALVPSAYSNARNMTAAIALPAMTMPSFPTFELPTFSVPTIRLPRFKMPSVTLPTFTLPTLPRFSIPTFTMPSFAMPYNAIRKTRQLTAAFGLAAGALLMSASNTYNHAGSPVLPSTPSVSNQTAQLLESTSRSAIETASNVVKVVITPTAAIAETRPTETSTANTVVDARPTSTVRLPSLVQAELAARNASPALGLRTSAAASPIPMPEIAQDLRIGFNRPVANTASVLPTFVGAPAPVIAKVQLPETGPRIARRPATRVAYEEVSKRFRAPRWVQELFVGKPQAVESRLMAYAEIADAASSAGANPTALLGTAKYESGFNPSSRARTSSATGPFQYIEQTWLAEFKKYGAQLGYQNQADAVVRVRGRHGRSYWTIRDPKLRKDVLDLRKDTWTSTMVTVEVMKEYQATLESARLGRAITSNDLHLCHVFGEAGGLKFLRSMARTPNAAAYKIFDADVVSANHNVFFNRKGQAYTLESVYRFYGRNFEAGQRLLQPAPDSNKPLNVAPEEPVTSQPVLTTPANPGTAKIDAGTPTPTRGGLAGIWNSMFGKKQQPAGTTMVADNKRFAPPRHHIG